ncbi:MAG: hypothetical protein KAW12_07255 [Candidatus Aminicenantes bacterium]|nr:hypothetical protein [Candidatus Aminicenantes bacterium]
MKNYKIQNKKNKKQSFEIAYNWSKEALRSHLINTAHPDNGPLYAAIAENGIEAYEISVLEEKDEKEKSAAQETKV